MDFTAKRRSALRLFALGIVLGMFPAGDVSPTLGRSPIETTERTQTQASCSSAASAPHLYLSWGTLTCVKQAGKSPLEGMSTARARGNPAHYLVQFEGPVSEADLELLQTLGADVLDYIPQFAFIVRMDETASTLAEELPRVRWIGPFRPEYKLSRALTRSNMIPHRLDIIVTLFPSEPTARIVSELEASGATLLDQVDTKWKSTLRVSTPGTRLAAIAAISGVRWVEETPARRVSNNVAVDILGVRDVWNTHDLHGEGQVVAICDTGLDQGSTDPPELHDDFEDGAGASRVLVLKDLLGDGAADIGMGHGTHVAGSVLGNGARSGATPALHAYPSTAYAGVAPEAALVFQAAGDASSYLPGIPTDLNLLFAQAATHGAQIHSNSWGDAAAGAYTSDAEAVDEYVWDHKDFTILFAAGNEGYDRNSDGVVDLASLDSPGTAKNCITVGASENNRLTGGWNLGGACSSYGNCLLGRYPSEPLKSDGLSDNADGIAAFSSRGPTLDGRTKPDLVAPGTNIASVRSNAETLGGWGVIDQDYMYMGGTSMATPLVAGAAAIVREYYTRLEGVTPSAALVKATLVNGAVNPAPGQYGTGPVQEVPFALPSNVAGWGRINLEHCLFPAIPRATSYWDSQQGLHTGNSHTYTVPVPIEGEDLRVTLAWSDYPGSPVANGGLVNDLDLKLNGPGGSHYATPSGPDRKNNLVGIRLNDPPTGTYTIEVSGYNIPFGPQPYALVASGGIAVPTISSIVPHTGINTGTVVITRLAGTHFQQGASLRLTLSNQKDIVAANVQVVSPTLVTGALDLRTAVATGLWDVVLVHPDTSRAVLPGGFTVMPAPGAPAVHSITPSIGYVGQVLRGVVLRGANFDGLGMPAVRLTRLGRTAITATAVTVVSSSTVSCDLDLNIASTGMWNVLVSNLNGLQGQLTNGFSIRQARFFPLMLRDSIHP
jgi:subtilisin family serine protease